MADKDRIVEIMKELWEAHLEYKNSRPESEKGYLILSYDTLFSESVLCWREEQTEKNKTEFNNSPTKPATAKQIAYATQLADRNNVELKLTGDETSMEISKLIDGLLQTKKSGDEELM
ncbi:MAG TPA: hypothetical protein VMZ91_03120 [Candidatus Paceibacterota bacterium]|nr:hypothetical protein [Candidatus Paceibacterota bacterium]